MKILPDIENTIEEFSSPSLRDCLRRFDYMDDMIKVFKIYGRQVRDASLQWAAENAHLKVDPDYAGSDSLSMTLDLIEIDQESILHGKNYIDLEI